MERFEIQKPNDYGDIEIMDEAADTDDGIADIVSISGDYGTDTGRRTLAERIKTILQDMADRGVEAGGELELE